MHQLALTIVLTSQGIPFLHAGTEFLRTKQGVENSYKSSDSINLMDWSLKKQNLALNNYVQTLIRLRKEHPAFRMTTSEQVKQHIQFADHVPAGAIVYAINGAAVNDRWKKIWVAFNGNNVEKEVHLPAGNWKTGIDTEGSPVMHSGHMHLKKFSAMVLYQE